MIGSNCNCIDIPTVNIRRPSFPNIIMSLNDSLNNIASMGAFLLLCCIVGVNDTIIVMWTYRHTDRWTDTQTDRQIFDILDDTHIPLSTISTAVSIWFNLICYRTTLASASQVLKILNMWCSRWRTILKS